MFYLKYLYLILLKSVHYNNLCAVIYKDNNEKHLIFANLWALAFFYKFVCVLKKIFLFEKRFYNIFFITEIYVNFAEI
jgi:hypothetical protein